MGGGARVAAEPDAAARGPVVRDMVPAPPADHAAAAACNVVEAVIAASASAERGRARRAARRAVI